METLNIHSLLFTFIRNNVFVFIIYFLFTFFQYPIHDVYIPEFYGKVINAFKDKDSKFIYFFKLGYEYGAVSADSLAPLFGSMILVIGFAAFLPYFLSIGETALKQQRGREDEDQITINQFKNV